MYIVDEVILRNFDILLQYQIQVLSTISQVVLSRRNKHVLKRINELYVRE